ncbi:MAG: hypothetical protein ACRD27_08285 [Terracidiphilus sp.]
MSSRTGRLAACTGISTSLAAANDRMPVTKLDLDALAGHSHLVG